MKTKFIVVTALAAMFLGYGCKKSSDSPASPSNANNNIHPAQTYGITATVGSKNENFSYCNINIANAAGGVIIGYR
jgi:hypothetical protein